jgi:hypothetical protein
VNEAHRRILAALPEDEPDCVPDWVCELLITLGYEQGHMEARASQPVVPAQTQEPGLTPKQEWWAGYRAGKGLPPDTPRREAVAVQAEQCEGCGQHMQSGPGLHVRVDAETGEHLPCFGESSVQAAPSTPLPPSIFSQKHSDVMYRAGMIQAGKMPQPSAPPVSADKGENNGQ